MFLGIICVDQIRSDLKRIIINRLFCSGLWICIVYLFLIHLPQVFCYLVGPLIKLVCFYHHVLKNALNQQGLIILNLIVLFRYIFIFWLKNRAAFHDDFWHFFLVIWSASFSFISQWIVAFPPGSQSLNFYLCSGTYPEDSDGKLSPKQNYPLRAFQFCTLIVLLCMYIRIKKFRRTGLQSTLQSNHGIWTKNHYLPNVDDEFFVSILLYLLSVFNEYSRNWFIDREN